MSQRPAPFATGSGRAGGTPATGVPMVEVDGVAEVDEHGAFAYAGCEVCGWRGPGRRSRERARTDLRSHLEGDSHSAVVGGVST